MARMRRNFVVKTIDGKTGGVLRALKAAGIEVVSVFEIFKEEVAAAGGEAEGGDAAAAAGAPETAGESAPKAS